MSDAEPVGESCASGPAAAPVLVVGVMNRCGTNYLAQLLHHHPDLHCPYLAYLREHPDQTTYPRPAPEDYLLKRADLLVDYADQTVRHWGVVRGTPRFEAARASLLTRLGTALLEELNEDRQPHQRLLLKTPRPFELSLAKVLFPRAQLVLLMRDGRDVVASAAKTFTYAKPRLWMQRWAKGARRLRTYTAAAAAEQGERWVLTRYDALYADPAGIVERLLGFLGLDPARYPWSRIDASPLIGSSTHRPDGEARVNWAPMSRPRDFQPIGRWRHWGLRDRLLFDHLAGRELRAWDYEPDRSWVLGRSGSIAKRKRAA